MASKNEVLRYVSATVEIHFEENHVACRYCPILETYSRDMCRRTGEFIIDTRGIGYECPLVFEKESEQ